MKRTSDFENRNRRLYDFVTPVWKVIFGEHFHIGYYQRGDETFDEATSNLVSALASMGNLAAGSKVLDVGCGVGGPAMLLHEEFDCNVVGISISERGIAEASAQARIKGYTTNISFSVTNAEAIGFAGEAFDVIWAMESFHLIKDKTRALAECFRVLKRGGQFLMCDIMVGHKLSISELLDNYHDLKLMERVYGKMQHETMSWHEAALKGAGFINILNRDISSFTHPTIPYFRSQVKDNYRNLVAVSSQQYVDDFLAMCEAHHRFDIRGINSYGMLKANKPY